MICEIVSAPLIRMEPAGAETGERSHRPQRNFSRASNSTLVFPTSAVPETTALSCA